MALQVVHDDRETHLVRHLVISCDECGARVNDQQIKDGGGLLEMGWTRRFNSASRRNEYFCPAHAE
jgi:hypothetical protein